MLREAIGQYEVGITKWESDVFGANSFQRKLSMTVFFPTDTKGTECPYQDATYQSQYPNSEENGVKTYCYTGVEPTSKVDVFPVIIYSHGLFGFEMESTVLCADLASSGYVVVSVGHPYGGRIVTYLDGTTFEDTESFEMRKKHLNDLVPLWGEDVQVAMSVIKEANQEDDWWKGRLLVENTGLVGGSFGGCCGIAEALQNGELRYVVNLDGSLFVDIHYKYKDIPLLILCSPLNYKAHKPLLHNGCGNVTVKKIRKITHWEFSDGIYLSERGKKNPEWARQVSESRANVILEFIASVIG